eukprot:11649351-Alexandrium_andersonii.AAC.1
MSASLVGSEMCIRDRDLMHLRTLGEVIRGVSPEYGIPASAGEGWGGAAVSYTHLTLPTICSV